ncbi:MAG: PQQ-dependent sugar dehydrogenase [Thermodesulfovibrionales bacterium]
MKKGIFSLLLLCCVVLLVWLAAFFWKHLRGAGPSLRSPATDIVRLMEKPETAVSDIPLRLQPGFSISVFAKGLDDPRVMILDPSDTLLVSVPSEGKVVALPDSDRDGRADSAVTVADSLDRPHGMAFRCATDCVLYVAEKDQVNAYSYNIKTMKAVKQKKIADLPSGGGHSTRTLLFLPKPEDDQLLISVGSSCNVCNEEDWRRAKVLLVSADGGDLRTFASGLRNSVFMAIHPETKKVWATEMGRDMLGDALPPDEINIIAKGRNYGWPFCYGKNVHDDAFDSAMNKSCREPETYPSHINIPAHSAPLGLAFFPQEGWSAGFRNNLLVAYHGSWNRSVPTGYKIVRYRFDEAGNLLEVDDFVSGWLTKNGTALGRPVDILIRPEGKIFVSDDKAGVIYRITRKSEENKLGQKVLMSLK